MNKQDLQGARTPAALEQRYRFGQSFAEAMGLATEAKTTAEEAKSAVLGLDDDLTQEELFNRLTNNGEDQGIFMHEGKIFINAQYLLAGSFTSAAEVFLEPGLEECETIKAHLLEIETIPSDKLALYDFNSDGDVDIGDLLICKSYVLG